jgi:hypothetical protein
MKKLSVFGMTTSPTPEQSATAILDVFKSKNCMAGDPLKISYVKAQFLKNHDSEAQYAAGLMYAEDNGWLEVTPDRDMFTLTDVGFAKIWRESGMRPADIIKEFEVTISETLVTAVHRVHKHKYFSRGFQIRHNLGRQPGRKIRPLSEDLKRLLGSNFSAPEYLRAVRFDRWRWSSMQQNRSQENSTELMPAFDPKRAFKNWRRWRRKPMDTKRRRCQFIVNQPAEGSPWIVAQPSDGGTLEVGEIRFNLRPSATNEDVYQVASFMNLWITEIELL